MSVVRFNWDITPAEKKRIKNASLASRLTWGTFALDALPDTLTDEAAGHEAAIDHSKDGEARDTSYGFVAAERLTDWGKVAKVAEEALSPMGKFDWDASSLQGRP